jgi:NADH-quinone oxidoreductase subunit A
MFNKHNILLLFSVPTGEKPASGPDLASLGIYTIMVIVILGLLMFLATWLGQKRHTPEKDRPYESGVIPTGRARLRVPVQFYLVAIFFIIFDLEAVFVYSWAVAFDILGWRGYAYITFFIVTLFAGLVYVWKKKGLEWGPKQK